MILFRPVFNVRDGKLGPDAIHACKRDIRTGMWNPTQTWDFCANHPESLHQFMMIYTDRTGTPRSFREMDGYGCHTFSFVNENQERFWVKFHIKSCLGAKGLTMEEAKIVAGEDPNFLSSDLIVAINEGNFPKWKMYYQVMPEEDGYQNSSIAFDPTKVWKHSDYPLIEVGEIELNENVLDHFCETEQVAFSPSNIVPGIGLSPDRLLQGRLLIYDDTQHHRLGPNFKKLPVNKPQGIAYPVNSMRTMGQMNTDYGNHHPNYADSEFGGPKPNPKYITKPFRVDGNTGYYPLPHEGTAEDYYQQPRDFWNVLSSEQQVNLTRNLAASFFKVTSDEVLNKMLHHMDQIDGDLGNRVRTELGNRESGKEITPNEKLVVDIGFELLHEK